MTDNRGRNDWLTNKQQRHTCLSQANGSSLLLSISTSDTSLSVVDDVVSPLSLISSSVLSLSASFVFSCSMFSTASLLYLLSHTDNKTKVCLQNESLWSLICTGIFMSNGTYNFISHG